MAKPPFVFECQNQCWKVIPQNSEKNFPKTNSLSKIFNRNTVKISYSCTRNMKSIISGHNKQMLHPKPKTNGCNCRDKNTCPLNV